MSEQAEQTPQNFLEVEIKLAVDEDTGIPDLIQLPGVTSIESTQEHNLSAVYYDTAAVSYTHLTLPTTLHECRSRWSPYH